MKKIFCIIFALVGISAYSLPWEEASNNLIKFFDSGSAIYIAEDKNNLIIFPKSVIRRVNVDENSVEIIVLEEDEEKDYDFKKSRHKITLDSNGNLIITKK